MGPLIQPRQPFLLLGFQRLLHLERAWPWEAGLLAGPPLCSFVQLCPS